MNYVKKLLNKKIFYLILIVMIILAVALLAILQFRNSQKVVFLIAQENYSYIKEDNTPLVLNINCSRDDTMYFEKRTINKCYISDYETNDSYLVELKDIKKASEKNTYNEQAYYLYKLSFKLPFSSNEIIKMNNFYLDIEYINEERVSLPMGTIAIASNIYQGSDVTISSLQGIVNEKNNNNMLVGITIKPNLLSKDIDIINLEAVSAVSKLNLSETKEITSDIENDQAISSILEKDYDILNEQLISELNLQMKSGKKYVIPLTYTKFEPYTTLGFIIKYVKNDEIFEQAIYPFKFFSSENQKNVKLVTYG